MKKIFLPLLLLLSVCANVPAQTSQANAGQQLTEAQKAERRQQLEAKRLEIRQRMVAFYTSRIGLTPEESDLFWPIYNEYSLKSWKINHELGKCFKKTEDAAANYTRVNKRIIELKESQATVDREFYEQLTKLLSPEKIYKFYQTEDAWTREILRQVDRK